MSTGGKGDTASVDSHLAPLVEKGRSVTGDDRSSHVRVCSRRFVIFRRFSGCTRQYITWRNGYASSVDWSCCCTPTPVNMTDRALFKNAWQQRTRWHTRSRAVAATVKVRDSCVWFTWWCCSCQARQTWDELGENLIN